MRHFRILLFLFAGCGFMPVPLPIPQYWQAGGSVSPYKTAAGIIRISEEGEPEILTVSGHGQLCLTIVSEQAGLLRVDFCETSTKVLGFHVTGDECLGRYTIGAQTMSDYMLVHFSVTTPRIISGRFLFNGASWGFTPHERSRPFTYLSNTPSHVRLSHDKAAIWEQVDDNSGNVDFHTHHSKKYTESNIYVEGTPQAGDAFSFRRELDIKNPQKVPVPLSEVVGGYFCNITVTAYYQ